ncbi:MAG: hypothetical protein EZS28_013394 [Streblomastix strix]|uniref:RNA polymerase II transcription factor B subunit 4 n=1 Tax=Streblomastix strix TaxID=222440 RepID=A0A5J4W828_9EUKA|nr:MAG: hypothetical protein EZS28_013394 [Streblomastix strix]
MAATKPPVLLVVLDLNPVIWGSYQNKDIPALSPEISLVSFLHEFQLFVAEYLALGEGKIRIMACTPRGCTFIPSTMKNQCGIATSDEIAGEIRRLAEREAEYACKHPLIYSSISGALSESLCYLNRIMRQNISQQQIQSSNSLFSSDFDMHKPEWGRILLLWASPESSDESQQVINAAFSAKRMNLHILPLLSSAHWVGSEQSNVLKTVENDSVDLKPKCACHGRTVDIAYSTVLKLPFVVDAPQYLMNENKHIPRKDILKSYFMKELPEIGGSECGENCNH